MDFLTRPIQSSTSHPSQYEIAAAPVHPTTSSHAQGGQSGASITSAPSTSADTASIMTSTSDGAESALAHTHAAFSQLRTSGGDPLEEDVAPPNARLADWRAWSKVEARIVVHPDGTLRKQNGKPRTVRKDTIREEWSIEGVVWVTHDHRLLFILDQTQTPRCISLKPEAEPDSPRRSLFSKRRSLSVERPLVPSLNESTAVESEAQAAPGTTSTSSSGVKGFVKKLFHSKSDQDANTSNEQEGLSLTRTRTLERGLKVERSKSLGLQGPTIPAPFPSFKGFSVTALHVSSSSSIVSVRYFPQHSDTSSSLFSSSSSIPVTYPSGTTDSPKVISSGLSLGTASVEQADVVPPCVEIDVAHSPAIMSRKMDPSEYGRLREVTIGFYFLEALLAAEAEELHKQLQAMQQHHSESQTAEKVTS